MLHNETYLWPRGGASPADDRSLATIVSDLIATRVVKPPFGVVTGAHLRLPFTVYSPLGDVLLNAAPPPAGIEVAYRGNDPARVVTALSRRQGEDVVVWFADVRPHFDDIPPERPHPVGLFAFAAPRDIELHQTRYDDDLRPIAGTEISRYRVCTAIVILGTELDTSKYRPVRDIASVLEKHLGPIEQQYDILH